MSVADSAAALAVDLGAASAAVKGAGSAADSAHKFHRPPTVSMLVAVLDSSVAE